MLNLASSEPYSANLFQAIQDLNLPNTNEATLRHFRETCNTYEGAILWCINKRLGIIPIFHLKFVSETYNWPVNEPYYKFLDSKLEICIKLMNLHPIAAYESGFEWWSKILLESLLYELDWMNNPTDKSTKKQLVQGLKQQLKLLKTWRNPVPATDNRLIHEFNFTEAAIAIAKPDPLNPSKAKSQFHEEAWSPFLKAYSGWIHQFNANGYIRQVVGESIRITLQGGRKEIIFSPTPKFSSGRGRKSK